MPDPPSTSKQAAKQLALADFDFNCFPPRLSLKTMSCKVRAEQLYPSLAREPFSFDQLCFDPLEAHQLKRNILSDPRNQCLMYSTADGPIGIMDDDDVQNAVRYAPRLGHKSVSLNVNTQDDLGQLCYPFACSKLIDD